MKENKPTDLTVHIGGILCACKTCRERKGFVVETAVIPSEITREIHFLNKYGSRGIDEDFIYYKYVKHNTEKLNPIEDLLLNVRARITRSVVDRHDSELDVARKMGYHKAMDEVLRLIDSYLRT